MLFQTNIWPSVISKGVVTSINFDSFFKINYPLSLTSIVSPSIFDQRVSWCESFRR